MKYRLVLLSVGLLVACGGGVSEEPAAEPVSPPYEEPDPWGGMTPPYEERAAEPVSSAVDGVDRGSWQTSRSTNPLDDSAAVVAVLQATEGVGGILDDEDFRLIARCESNRTQVYVTWHDFLGLDGTQVTYRFPPADAVSESWSLSTDNTVTFVANPIPFLRELVASDRLVMQTIPYNENPSRAIFDLTGAREAIVPIAETCGWTLPALEEATKSAAPAVEEALIDSLDDAGLAGLVGLTQRQLFAEFGRPYTSTGRQWTYRTSDERAPDEQIHIYYETSPGPGLQNDRTVITQVLVGSVTFP